MKRLLQAELIRRLTSIIYISELIFLVIYNVFKIIASNYGFEINISYFLFENTALISIFTAVNVSLKLSQELEYRTINNKLFLGITKKNFFIVESIVGILEGFILLLTDTISVIILGYYKGYIMDVTYSDISINFAILLLTITTVVMLSSILTLLIPTRVISVIVVFCLSFLLLYGGKDTVSALNQPAQTTLFSVDGKMDKNPLYVDGGKRVFHNAHLFLSPYAKAEYSPCLLSEDKEMLAANTLFIKSQSFHLEFIISNVIECILLFILGLHFFKKKNLN